MEDARGRYVAFAKNTFPRNISLEGLRLVVDAAHGAAYRVAPAVFSELGASVRSIGVQPDGVNINEGVGALHPDKARAEVVKTSAQMGIALDGDADRVILIDEHGQVIDGDSVLAMCALEMAETGTLKKSAVVATVMSNLGLERALARKKIRLVRTAVGDRHVVDAMRKGGLNLGGEQSGHLVFLDHASTGDGIVAALQVLALMIRRGRPLSELAAQAMTRVPQVLQNVTLPKRRPIEDMKKLQVAHAVGFEIPGPEGPDPRPLERNRAQAEGDDRGRKRGRDHADGAVPGRGGPPGFRPARVITSFFDPTFQSRYPEAPINRSFQIRPLVSEEKRHPVLESYGQTDVGRRRKLNEDSFDVDDAIGLYVVCDGMGGHNAGEVASKLALETIKGFVDKSEKEKEITWPYGLDVNLSFHGNRLCTAIKLANRKVFKTADSRKSTQAWGPPWSPAWWPATSSPWAGRATAAPTSSAAALSPSFRVTTAGSPRRGPKAS